MTDIIKDVETYTYKNESDKGPLEVLLIGVDPREIGSENTFEPPGFYINHITTWIRQRYYFLDGFLYAQIPIQFKKYSDLVIEQFDNASSSFATDVTYDSKENKVHVYYPVSDTESICLSWDLTVDHWSMSRVPQPVNNENIVLDEGHAEDTLSIWNSI